LTEKYGERITLELKPLKKREWNVFLIGKGNKEIQI
jgi:hypothetical protein